MVMGARQNEEEGGRMINNDGGGGMLGWDPLTGDTLQSPKETMYTAAIICTSDLIRVSLPYIFHFLFLFPRLF